MAIRLDHELGARGHCVRCLGCGTSRVRRGRRERRGRRDVVADGWRGAAQRRMLTAAAGRQRCGTGVLLDV